MGLLEPEEEITQLVKEAKIYIQNARELARKK